MIRGILLLWALSPRCGWAYQREDHYATVRLALPRSFPADDAAVIATCAQLPDEVPELSAIDIYRRLMKHPLDYSGWAVSQSGPVDTVGRMVTVQQLLHALTGGSPAAMRSVASRIVKAALGGLNAPSGRDKQARADALCALGFAFHLYGDSYSHQMLFNREKLYHTGVGHLFDSARPDFPLYSPARLGLFSDYLLSVSTIAAAAPPPAVGRALADSEGAQASASESNGYNALELRRRLGEQIRGAGIDDLHTPFDRRLAGRGCQAVLDRQAKVDALEPVPSCERAWEIFRSIAMREFSAYEKGPAPPAPLRDPAYRKVPFFEGSPFSKGPQW